MRTAKTKKPKCQKEIEMKIKTLALLSVIALGANSNLATAAQLSVGTEGDYPPWSMADANGSVTGYDADVANLICAKLRMECKFVVQAFDSLIPALQTKRFDIIISGLSITEARAKSIDFSIGYSDIPNVFAVVKGSDLLKASTIPEVLAAMSGKKVGVVAGTIQENFITKAIPTADLKTYESADKLQIDLAASRIEAAFADVSSLEDFVNKPDGSKFELSKVTISGTYDGSLGSGIGVGIQKGNTELKAKIDKALCDSIKDGSLAASSMKWFKRDITVPCKM
jgi:octopine/nopaline transport system substrate-binding protein